jgi:hypothetical protein
VDHKADAAAIEAAYKSLTAEFHPDNRKTGDAEKYKQVQTAYEVLSNPATRADFDKLTAPVSEEISFPAAEFVAGLGADATRRLCLLCILYYRLKHNPISPALPLRNVSELMLISDMDLEFNVWYLKKKALLTTDDKSRLLITVDGIDYVEGLRPTLEMIKPALREQQESQDAEPESRLRVNARNEPAAGETSLASPAERKAPTAEQRAAANPASLAALGKVLAKLGNNPRAAGKPEPGSAKKV